MKVIFANENMILLREGELFLTVPDLITLVSTSRKVGLTNEELKVGEKVDIYVGKCYEFWKSKKGIKVFNPRVLGLNYQVKLL